MGVPVITQLPPAPQRTDLPVEFSNKADVFVAALAPFRSELNSYGNWMNLKATEIAQDKVDTTASRNAAATSASQASSSASSASSSASSASSSASTATTRRNEAAASATLAERFANEDEDVVVQNGLFSAKHYALKAQLFDPSSYPLKTVQMIAGNGITGGGTIESNRTFTLGTPSTLTTSTTNSTTASSHTHAVTFPVVSVAGKTGAVTLTTSDVSGAVPDARTIAAGNGITGGGSLAANRTLTLGTPSTLTTTTTNSVSSTSHTHEVNFPVVSVAGKTGGVTLTNGDVGLSNVANVDQRNANNLTSGTVPNARISGQYNNFSSIGASGNIVGGTVTSNSEVRAGSGTAPTPSYSWTSDSNTGMYSAGANVIGFTCNGTQVGTINSNGFSGNGSQLTSLNASNVSSGTLSVSRGGTGGGNAATARNNLGVGTMATRNLSISSSAPAPANGNDGDIHFRLL